MDKGVPVNQKVRFVDHGQRMVDVGVRMDGALSLFADEARGTLPRAVPS